MIAERLDSQFRIGDRLRITEAKAGFPMVAINTPLARAVISVYAGQVLSYQPHDQEADLLFLSDGAYYQPGKAIKGGVPVCWPWFGPDPDGRGRPGHGFVRNRPWTLRDVAEEQGGAITVRLGLVDTAETREIWDHAFDLELDVRVGTTLDMALVTRNRGGSPFSLSQGLHTYFRVGDINRVTVTGLAGHRFIDKMDGGLEKTQDGAVTIAGEVDRIYTGVVGPLAIEDRGLGRKIAISTAGSASAVIWNPWQATAKSMADLGDEDYRTLLCVETTNAGPDVVSVPADGEHRLSAVYEASALS